MMLRNFVLEYI